jgi:multiple sugar transport system ATP-binding protein
MRKISLINLKKSFGSSSIIPRLNLSIEPGEFVVLVGPSGCGKSTLLRLIAGLEPVSSGEIQFNGKNAANLSPKERQLAMVFQNYALYPHMTVAENIAFTLENRRWEKSRITAKVNQIADTLGLGPWIERYPRELSGGQRQRVALGRALAPETDLILMDEPLSNLDAQLRASMRAEIKKLHRQIRSTVIYVTHDQLEATTLADRLILMEKGEIIQEGSPESFYREPKNQFVAQFIGSPEINFFQMPEWDTKNEWTFGIRPEHIKLSRNQTPGHLGPFSGRLTMIDYLGSQKLLYIEWKNIMLRALAPEESSFPLDSYLDFNLDVAHLHKFMRTDGRRVL